MGKSKTGVKGSVAEWSKALALGASPKGRGFEPHHYQSFFFLLNSQPRMRIDKQQLLKCEYLWND